MTNDLNRRQFIETAGYTTLGLALAAALPTVTRAAQGNPDFDIDKIFADFSVSMKSSMAAPS